MKVFRIITIVAAVVLSPASAFSQDNMIEQMINRRDQARRAFLASPQDIYLHYCAHCHGEDGKGGGRLWATELSPQPADLSVTGRDKAVLVKFITDGAAVSGQSNLCPPWGRTISPVNMERLSLYILSLGGKLPGPSSQGLAPLDEAGGPFPWLLVVVLIVEIVILWQITKRGKQDSGSPDRDVS